MDPVLLSCLAKIGSLLLVFLGGSLLCALLALVNAPRWVCIASSMPSALLIIWKGWL